jgi:hypothetical protein
MIVLGSTRAVRTDGGEEGEWTQDRWGTFF